MDIGVFQGDVPRTGRILAVSGVDGAGKSTVVERLAARLGATGRIARVSAGKPQAAWLETLRRRWRNGDDTGEGGEKSRGQGGCKVRLRDALSSLVLAVLRWRLSRHARRLARAGVTVVADRWPTLEYGKMDGPRIATGLPGLNGAVLRLLAGWERAIYRRIEPADIVFHLVVDEQTAIARNAARVKADKESTQDIVRRFRDNLDFQPIAHRVERIDNLGTLQEVLAVVERHLEQDR